MDSWELGAVELASRIAAGDISCRQAAEGALERIGAGDALVLLSHEAVHVEQWREYGVAGFLVRYLGDYVRGRAVGLPHHVAYRAIRFEREAVKRSEQT